MKIFCFSNCAVLCFITHTFTVVNANNEDGKKTRFKTKGSTIILPTENTTDVYSQSLILCAGICLSDPKCCVASYSKGASLCRIDMSERCCVETKPHDGWRFIQRNSYLTRTGYICHGDTLFSIYEDQVTWTKAKENCELFGGKLAELETSEENDFLKRELTTRSTEEGGYWIGGYNFHNDDDMEWVGEPNQVMPFSDMAANQPNSPMTQLCMVMWKSWDFQWADYYCGSLLSYVCEFMHR